LGDIVYIELPEIGTIFDQKDECAVIESVKIASEIYSPASGEVIEVNEALGDNPALINDDALGNGWICKIKITDTAELDDLQSENDYEEFLKDQA
jgi:glycine cleavage system H protein